MIFPPCRFCRGVRPRTGRTVCSCRAVVVVAGEQPTHTDFQLVYDTSVLDAEQSRRSPTCVRQAPVSLPCGRARGREAESGEQEPHTLLCRSARENAPVVHQRTPSPPERSMKKRALVKGTLPTPQPCRSPCHVCATPTATRWKRSGGGASRRNTPTRPRSGGHRERRTAARDAERQVPPSHGPDGRAAVLHHTPPSDLAERKRSVPPLRRPIGRRFHHHARAARAPRFRRRRFVYIEYTAENSFG